MKRVCFFLILLALAQTAIIRHSLAQDSIMLKGRMVVSISNGTIDCDFQLTNIPKIANYYIRLNAGMNVRNFKNVNSGYKFAFEKDYNDTTHEESFGYYFPSDKGSKFLPRDGIQLSYVGKFPVIADTLNEAREDWKGNIAFNGYSVRADGFQSAWYPVLCDIKTDKMYEKVKCDIEIECSDCNTIYVNGNLPVQGQKAHFKNDVPAELMLYAGNYKVADEDGTYFLNPDLSKTQIAAFGALTNKFKKFYATKLGIPYTYKITYIQTTPVSKDSWLFVSYPTIVTVGRGEYSMSGFFDKKKGDYFKTFMAHELGHYYFGTYKVFNSELGDVMSEGFAEYLSWQATRKFLNDTLYAYEINKKIKSLKDFKAIPFAKIKSKKDYKNRELYSYYYAPIIFTAIEKEIGMKNMWRWMSALLKTKTEFTNYAFLEQTLAATIKDKHKLKTIKEKYFASDSALENAIKTVSSHDVR